MLKRYLAEVDDRKVTSRTGLQAEDEVKEALQGSLEFLADPHGFPDAQVNIVAGALGYLLRRTGSVRVIDDEDVRDPILLLETPQTVRGYRKAGIVLPLDYHYKVKDDPLSTLTDLAVAAERIRGFLANGRMANHQHMPLGAQYEQRVQARLGGTAHTLQVMAAQERVAIEPLAETVQAAAEHFPGGFADLPPDSTHLGIGGRAMPAGLGQLPTNFLAGIEAQVAQENYYHPSADYAVELVKASGTAFGSLARAEQALRGIDSPLHLHAGPEGPPELLIMRSFPDGTPGHACTGSLEAYDENLQALEAQ